MNGNGRRPLSGRQIDYRAPGLLLRKRPCDEATCATQASEHVFSRSTFGTQAFG